MGEKYYDVYTYLNKIEELDGNIYSKLLTVYGEEIVNSVIKKLMDEDVSNLVKFDYFVSKIISYDEKESKNLYESYGDDLSFIPQFSKEENIRLTGEMQFIMSQIKGLFEFANQEEENNFDEGWLCDNVDCFMKQCKDREKLEEMKIMYDKFLLVRNRLIEGNLRLVIVIAKQFNLNETVFIEAIQLGNMGLMRAVEKFSPKYNVTFATYAYYWIRQSITRGIYDVIYPYSIPAYQIGIYHSYKKNKKNMFEELGREPTNEELAERMNIRVDNIKLVMTMFNDPISLYETYGTDEDRETMLIEFIEDKSSSVFKDLEHLELSLSLEKSMDLYLTDWERIVINGRYGFNNGKCDTLEIVGKKIGRTIERVRQIENKALRKLRVRCRDLKDYM